MNNKTLIDNLRCVPDFPRKGINFRDVTTLFKNAECVKIMLDELVELYKDKGITKIVGVESRGFVMASALAAKLGCGIVLARKPGKLPSVAIKESFTKEYGIDSNTSVEKKYKSKACDYYRKYLKNLVEKISDPNFQQIELIKPNSEEGKQIVEIKKGNEDVNNMNIIGEFNQQKKDEGIFGVFGSFFNNVKKTATEVSGKISKGIEELKITDKLKEAGDKISDNAKIVGNYIKDKSQKVVNSDFVQGITKTAESGINVVIEKTKVLLNKNENRPENVNIVLLNNEQKQDEQNNIQNQDIQMSNIISENNNINNINLNNNNEKNELGKGGEIKNEENKKEEIQNEEIPKEDKIDEKKEENNINNGNNNNVIDNKKIEEENVKFEPEKQNGQ